VSLEQATGGEDKIDLAYNSTYTHTSIKAANKYAVVQLSRHSKNSCFEKKPKFRQRFLHLIDKISFHFITTSGGRT
jgi:hypothetical protein